MATLKATRDELLTLVPIISELAGDVQELDTKVKELLLNADPQTIDEIATLVADMKTQLRAAADVVPETAPPPPPPPPEPLPPV